jgi:hypothetical protein
VKWLFATSVLLAFPEQVHDLAFATFVGAIGILLLRMSARSRRR